MWFCVAEEPKLWYGLSSAPILQALVRCDSTARAKLWFLVGRCPVELSREFEEAYDSFVLMDSVRKLSQLPTSSPNEKGRGHHCPATSRDYCRNRVSNPA